MLIIDYGYNERCKFFAFNCQNRTTNILGCKVCKSDEIYDGKRRQLVEVVPPGGQHAPGMEIGRIYTGIIGRQILYIRSIPRNTVLCGLKYWLGKLLGRQSAL